MYFLSFDTFHIVSASLFLLTTLGVVYFRYRKYLFPREKTINYTINGKSAAIRIVSLILSLIILGTALLEPAGLRKDSSTDTLGIDCIWLLDVSLSMDVPDITDATSTISRLTKAKSVIENYIIAHPENRYGLVIFAGKSRVVSPLTSEHSSLLTFLASIDSKSISEGGTDFRGALGLATERFDTKDPTPHAIVLLSDGGDREDAPDMSSIRNLFREGNANLTDIGLGQTKPSPIPIGQDPLWETVYKKFQGETVLSGLNRDSLENLAEAGKWSYIEGGSIEKDLEKSLSTISRHAFQDSWDDSNDMTVQIFVMAGFFFFLVFLLLSSSFLKQWNAL